MNIKQVYFGLIGLIVLLGVLFAGSIWLANSLLESQSHVLATAKTDNQVAMQRQALLSRDKKDIKTYSDLNTIAKSVVPQDKDQAEAVREIISLAAQSGIPQLSSISFEPSTLGGTVKNGLTQVTPVKGIPGVYNLQITITQDNTTPVPYTSFLTFLGKIEQNRRTAQISSIDIQPDPKNRALTSFTLIVNEFIKP